jgi:uncharacterized protein (TIGR02246 family)
VTSAGQTTESHQKAIRTSFREWLKAAESGDADAYVSFLTDDAVVVSPGQAELSGRAAILTSVREFVARNVLTFADWRSQEIVVFGDAALHRYTIVTTLHPKGGGDPVAQEQRYLDVLRRGADGQWRVSHHTFNVGK